MNGPTVSAAIATALIDFAVSKGARPATLRERAGLSREDRLAPDDRVPLPIYLALLRMAKDLCSDPAFALHFGEAFNVAELSVGGLVPGFTGSMTEGFALMNRYARLSMDVPCAGDDRFLFERSRGEVWMVDTRTNPNEDPEITETAFARMVTSARSGESGRPLFSAVRFTHAEPTYRSEYDRIFRIPLAFRCTQNALRLDPEWLDRKPPLSSAAGLRALKANAEQQLALLDDSQTEAGRVELLIKTMLPRGEATVARLAVQMGVSRQTLYRRLKAEGTSFEQLLDEVRRKLALHYLRVQKLPISEAAYLLGFSDPTAFSRAVKRWTGSTPRAISAKK